MATSIKVMGRINPAGEPSIVFSPPNSICTLDLQGRISDRKYSFDHVFTTESTQEEVFEKIGRPTVDNIMMGYNGTVFAYGQTGSGKTHTMLAPGGGSPKCLDPDGSGYEHRGLIPRMAVELISRLKQQSTEKEQIVWKVRAAYYEIYNEELIDLLVEGKSSKNDIAFVGTKETFKIRGLKEVELETPEGLLEVMRIGAGRRHIASHEMNERSSRSHSILQLLVEQKDTQQGSLLTSQLNLVDLAGSERVGKTGASREVAYEGTRINLSLTRLGLVIKQLCEGFPHVSFRDSLLTRVLQNSLGGNAYTTLICTFSQIRSNQPETISTLQFAERAKQVKNRAVINKQRSAAEWELLYQQAQQKIEKMERMLQVKGEVGNDEAEGDKLQELRVQLELEREEGEKKERELAMHDEELLMKDNQIKRLQEEIEVLKVANSELTAKEETTQQTLKHMEQRIEELLRDKQMAEDKANETAAREEQLEAELEDLENEKEDLELQNAELRAETSHHKKCAADLQAKVEELTRTCAEAAATEKMLRMELSSATAEKVEGADREDAMKQLAEQRATEIAELSGQKLKLEVANEKLVKTVAEKDEELAKMDSLRKSNENLLKGKEELKSQVTQLKQDKRKYETELMELQGKYQREVSEHKILNDERISLQTELDQLKKHAKSSKEELDKLRSASEENERLERELLQKEKETEELADRMEMLVKQVKQFTDTLTQRDKTIEQLKELLQKLLKVVKVSMQEEDRQLLDHIEDLLGKKDALDELASRLYDRKAQEDLISHVYAALSERQDDIPKLQAKVDNLTPGDVVSDSLKNDLALAKNQAERIVSVLTSSDSEFYDSEQEARRQVAIEGSKDVARALESMMERIKTISISCPLCSKLCDTEEELKEHKSECAKKFGM